MAEAIVTLSVSPSRWGTRDVMTERSVSSSVSKLRFLTYSVLPASSASRSSPSLPDLLPGPATRADLLLLDVVYVDCEYEELNGEEEK